MAQLNTAATAPAGRSGDETGPNYKRLVREYIYQGRLFASGYFFSILLQVFLMGPLGSHVSDIPWLTATIVTIVAALAWWYVWYRKCRKFDRAYVKVINLANSTIQLKKFNRFTRIWANLQFATALLMMYILLTCVSLIINESRLRNVAFHRNEQPSSRQGNKITVDLSRRDLSYAVLRGAALPAAILDGTKMNYCNLENADLEAASLRGASLVGANLRSANLRGAILIGTDLQDADLRGAKGLKDDQLSAAVNAKSALRD